jgi:hypothetical protein|tara:strand:- start:248 stop:499 length:252 start_codon:yes stop_codon:yes gene_type:complete
MSKIKTFFTRATGAIPNLHWWHYAAFRLGSFWITYFCTTAVIAFILIAFGVTLGVGVIFLLIPISVLVAIRISGQISERYREK